MALHAPITPTQNTPTVTDKQSARVQVRPWREALVITFGLLFLIYATVIIAGLKYTGWERMLPPQMNSVSVTTLAVLFVTSLQLLLHHRASSRRDDQFVVLSGQLAAMREQVVPETGRRNWTVDEPPTVPDLASRRPRIYASFAAVYSSQMEAFTEAAVRRLSEALSERDERYAERFAEFEEQLRDFALLQQAQHGIGRGGVSWLHPTGGSPTRRS